MAFSNLRPARTVQHHGRSSEAPMDYEYNSPRASIFRSSNLRGQEAQEPPRKRTHYEAMDWSAEPPTRPAAILSQFASSSSVAHPTPSSSSSSSSPFMFDSSSIMQVDEPVDASSNIAQEATNAQTSQRAARDIASGAIQRERRKRDKLKDWQVAKGVKGTYVQDDDQDDEGSEEEQQAENDRNGPEDSPGFAGQIQRLLRRNRSGRRNQQPVHLSLHNHNYHYPTTSSGSGQDPFVFGSSSAVSTTGSNSLSHLSSTSPTVQIENPSHWWREEGPYILLGYLQFIFNTSLVLLSLYFLISFLLMLSSDIRERTAESSIELQQEIMHCSEMYIQNRCTPGERVPAMEGQCMKWEFCMNRNPKVVGRARVGAETLAEVVNGFTEVISWRTMLFLLAILAIVVSFTNSTISSYRRSHTAYHANMQHQTGQPYVAHDHQQQHQQRLGAKGNGERRFVELK